MIDRTGNGMISPTLDSLDALDPLGEENVTPEPLWGTLIITDEFSGAKWSRCALQKSASDYCFPWPFISGNSTLDLDVVGEPVQANHPISHRTPGDGSSVIVTMVSVERTSIYTSGIRSATSWAWEPWWVVVTDHCSASLAGTEHDSVACGTWFDSIYADRKEISDLKPIIFRHTPNCFKWFHLCWVAADMDSRPLTCHLIGFRTRKMWALYLTVLKTDCKCRALYYLNWIKVREECHRTVIKKRFFRSVPVEGHDDDTHLSCHAMTLLLFSLMPCQYI